MDWRQFLFEERDRKLALIRLLMTGSVSIVTRSEDGECDVSARIVQEKQDQVAQIEAVLEGGGSRDKSHRHADFSALLERSAHQLAALTQAVHDLGHHGPAVMQKGLTILDACETQIRRLSRQASGKPGKDR
jgi:hypothetical protein